MSGYLIREAALDDLDVLVHHRVAMFSDMGTTFDAPIVERMFRDWLRQTMTAGDYRAWVCEAQPAEVVAGAEPNDVENHVAFR